MCAGIDPRSSARTASALSHLSRARTLNFEEYGLIVSRFQIHYKQHVDHFEHDLLASTLLAWEA